MSLDVAATTFIDAIGRPGQLVVLLLVGIPAMLVTVFLTRRAANRSSRVAETTPGRADER
nr:hypothetical protein [Chloroflexota bacterium]